ncbi:MAG: iron-containing alcohol dehydrogenase [Candidatus Hydrogenedentes bacterium]|nr:iron-containing alcohol dehydrogenase [Candidatus Hydrogenedentota bacterium]
MKPYRYLMPTEVLFGAGRFEELGKSCRVYGQRPLIITGRNSARTHGFLERALAQLPGAVIFDQVEENPVTETCERGATLCRERGCDVVVAIGGGSPMDVAKAVAGLALNPEPCRAYFGADLFKHGVLPILAVPTTAGTGSEVTPYAVIVDSALHAKRTISGRQLFPAVAILDPELTVPLPRAVTIQTGLDALSQAMEGMVSRKSTEVGDALALEACRLIAAWLPRVAYNGADIEGRTSLLHAAMLAGCVIAQSGTTLVHGMGYYFTLEYGVAHGLANALLLTPLFRYNAQFEPAKVAALAGALGFPADPITAHAGAQISAAIHALLKELGVPPAAKDACVSAEAFAGWSKQIHADPYRYRNQVGNITVEDIHRFFLESYEGVGAE